MPHSPPEKVCPADAARRLLDEMDFAVAALGALTRAARQNGQRFEAEYERMEDLANRLLDLSEQLDTEPDGPAARARSLRADLQ